MDRSWGFVVIWQFRVRAGKEVEFERGYGPQGEWARLFRQDSSFVGTQLVRDERSPGTYLTLDFWNSQQAYEKFRSERAAEYERIDARCETLTESEQEIGRYTTVKNVIS